MASARITRLCVLTKENWIPALTVAMVSVPLSAALAIATQATPIMGLRAAVYAPLMAGAFGGSHYNIFGPAGALINILAAESFKYDVEILPVIALCTGVCGFIMWALDLARFISILPRSALEGFSLAVSLIIAQSQLNFALGLKDLTKHAEIHMNLGETFSNLDLISWKDFVPFLVFFFLLLGLMKRLPGRPWMLCCALVGIVWGVIVKEGDIAPLRCLLLADLYPTLGETGFEKLADFGYWENSYPFMDLLVAAVKTSFVGVLETLISAKIGDGLTGTRYDQSQEVFGFSLANLLAGFMGGTPATGVLVRTSVNINFGATNRCSEFLVGIWVLLMIVVILPLFIYIPMPCIAAILMNAAVGLVPIQVFKDLWRLDKADLSVLLFTFLLCVFVDGAVGLIVGAAVGLLRNANASSKADICILAGDSLLENKGDTLVIRKGCLTYLVALDTETQIMDKLAEEIEKGELKYILLDLGELDLLDYDGLNVIALAFTKKDKINIGAVKPRKEVELFNQSGLHEQLTKDGMLFDDVNSGQKALSALKPILPKEGTEPNGTELAKVSTPKQE